MNKILLFIGLAYSLKNLGPTLVIVIMLLMAWMLTGIVFYLRQKKQAGILAAKSRDSEIIKPRKILTLMSDPVEAE